MMRNILQHNSLKHLILRQTRADRILHRALQLQNITNDTFCKWRQFYLAHK